MTFKLHLDLQLLSTAHTAPYAPWWANETSGSLRQQRSNSSKPLVANDNGDNVYKQERYNKSQGGLGNASALATGYKWRGAIHNENGSLAGDRGARQAKTSFRVVKQGPHSFTGAQKDLPDDILPELLQEESMRGPFVKNSSVVVVANRTAAPALPIRTDPPDLKGDVKAAPLHNQAVTLGLRKPPPAAVILESLEAPPGSIPNSKSTSPLQAPPSPKEDLSNEKRKSLKEANLPPLEAPQPPQGATVFPKALSASPPTALPPPPDSTHLPKGVKSISSVRHPETPSDASPSAGNLPSGTPKSGRTPKDIPPLKVPTHAHLASNPTKRKMTPNLALKSPSARSSVLVKNKGLSHDEDTQEVSLGPEEILRIRQQIEKLNEAQKILNLGRYGPVQPNTTVLLVQVHNRLENLRFLVESLTNTRYINETLVLFSHDLWDEAINAFVGNISAFRVMQMFFPFSVQLHPHVFPGRDPRDCKWDVKMSSKNGQNCLNREWPDSYGHYREPRYTQIKHHWWWKIHRVFEDLRVTGPSFEGEVIFLEEDHFVAPDLLHMHRLLRKTRDKNCPECLVLSLGNYNKMAPSVYKNYVERGDWWVTKQNLGFVLSPKVWRSIKKCTRDFCEFDDYNWDWTLNHVAQKCFKPRLKSFALRFSRVYHVGSCGTHVKKKSCDVRREVLSVMNRINLGRAWLFPESLVVQSMYRGASTTKRGNGGWGDYRDRQFCKDIAAKAASEEALKKLQF
ncbi:uncharacterized protein LOC143035313 [Oratosquilla oratoria]|uniref:uncharacterized protein LOC143035313 n=1 Tax=Oratosquilla oratoria TaxID=337810 RepID=UPI003F777ED9